MLNHSPVLQPVATVLPTVWGLDPIQLHDRYWAARGICVVRPGAVTPLPHTAQLFMLTDAKTLALFSVKRAVDRLYWVKPAVLFIRLRNQSASEYRELVRADELGRFVRFERQYGQSPSSTSRIALTRDRRVAEMWQARGTCDMWRELRRQTRTVRRETLTTNGRRFDATDHVQLDGAVMALVDEWHSPSTTVEGVQQVRQGVWSASESGVEPSARIMGNIWVGVGRLIPSDASVMGPAVLWDDPTTRVAPRLLRWNEIDPAPQPAKPRADRHGASTWRRVSQRAFDIAFATLVLLATLPLYPLIMAAIWLEDGRPFFFGHRRETRGGREFPCLKFRSMRKDADHIRARLAKSNQSDGPQFFIENDPRVTRVGRFLRKTNLDELPQFINVLLGHMAVVGPRPSPRSENQCCPAWREARLSVRPGITGLWQVSRTRRQGLDFQEWIRFDVQYVESASWLLDLKIVLRTMRIMLGA